MPSKPVAVYTRVSSDGQRHDAQEHELRDWLTGRGYDLSQVEWFRDTASGKSLARPGFERMQAAIFAGKVRTVIAWRVDRLSRNLRDGINLLADWCERGIEVIITTQQIELKGTVGKMVAALMLGLAEMEREAIRARQRAGIDAARKRGVTLGGSKKGRRLRVTDDKIRAIRQLHKGGESIVAIAKSVGLSRPTVYRLLESA